MNLPKRQRLVGIATESVTAFGRSILWGVVKYANLQRDWILHKDIWSVESEAWPDCDGTIIGGINAGAFPNISKHSRHIIACSGNYDPNELPVVRLDDDATGAMAAEHLIELGLKQFASYGGVWDRNPWIEAGPRYALSRRIRGFEMALHKHGLSSVGTAYTPSNVELLTHSHHTRLIQWLRSLPKPIGIIGVDDSHANDLAVACRKGEVAVPDHVAIIGVNNDKLLCEGAWPPLSSVECNFTRMGYLAAKTLDRMMKGETLHSEERLTQLPPIRVHQRMSTDVFAIDQPEVAEALKYIRGHACEPCSVKDVIKEVPVSRRTLETYFADKLGRTIHDEISRVRVETAKRLLVLPDLPIDEIGKRCGFSTPQSFNRFFRQAAGNTPAAFRRQSLRDTRSAIPLRDRAIR